MYKIFWYHRKDIDHTYDESKITVHYEDRDRVRQSPAIYLPGTDIWGAVHLFEEIYANSTDELCIDDSVGKEIIVTYDEKTRIFSVQDDGRGLPFGKAKELTSVLSSSGKMGDKNRAYNHSTGAFGHGLKLVNFFSEYMKIRIERDGKFLELHYVDGILKEEKTGKAKGHGTYVEWKIDKRFFSSVNIMCDMITDKIKKKSYVVRKPVVVFNGIDKKGKEVIKEFKNTKLRDFVTQFEVVGPIIEATHSGPNINLEYAFSYDPTLLDDLHVLGYTNGSHNISGGTHVEGLIDGINTFMKKYMEVFLSEKERKDLQIKREDIKTGLIGIVSIHALNPKYKGQYKEGLDDTKLGNFIAKSVRNYLKDLNKTALNKLAMTIKTNAKARQSAENAKKKVKKDITNAFSADKIPDYLPISTLSTSTFTELEIVEGLSALGPIQAVRDVMMQAALAIRGKIENVFDLTPSEAVKKSKFLDNMVHILECENGSIANFDVNKMPFDRINIMTDADSDGGEISSQAAVLFAKFFRPLVEAGKLFKVVPPLYEIKVDGKNVFVPTVRDFVEYAQKNFGRFNKLYLNGRQIKGDLLLDFVAEYHEYVDKLERTSAQHVLTPELCEFLISNLSIGFENDKVDLWNNKILPQRFRFLQAMKGEDGYIIIKGMVGNDYNMFEFDEEFIEDITEQYKIDIDSVFYGYKLNNKENLSLYEIMKEFFTYAPKILNRFKGLGQMPSYDLERTMMDRKVRHSIQITMDNYEDAFERMSVMHSKKGKRPEQRKEFMKRFKFDLMDIDT